MKYTEDFEEFLAKAEVIYRSNPLKTRYLTKYVHSKGKMVLKVTDDNKVRSTTTYSRSVLHESSRLMHTV